MKKILTLLLITIALAMSSYAQSTKSEIRISAKDNQNSTLFQSLKGKDRLDVYKQLHTLIRVKGSASDVVSASNRIGAKTTTLDEVISLLGEPDSKIQQTILEYHLKGLNSETRLVIGIDKNKEVEFATIKSGK